MVGAQYRIQKWEAKVKPARLLADLTVLVPTMVANFSAITPAIVAMETSVKQSLDAAGVPTIEYPFYLCYGREIWSLQNREFSGESLAIIAACKLAKWVARGLNSTVLIGLRNDVFSVPAPVAP